MSDATTPRLEMPFLVPGQAQKEMGHNEALTILDIAVQGSVVAVNQNSPPEDAVPGKCWIVGAAPEGAWIGHADALAGWTEGGWRFLMPVEGMRLWVDRIQGFALYSSGIWTFGEVYGRLLVNGDQVIGPRGDLISEPEGGMTVDAEARAAIGAILEAMRGHGLIETVIL